MKSDANFDNTSETPIGSLVIDPGRNFGSPETMAINGRAWGVLACGDDFVDALFPYDTPPFYRLVGFAANSRYKGRRYTFQINDPKTVKIEVITTFFTPFITVQRTYGSVAQAVGGIEFVVTEATSGEYAIEVSSVEENKTGPFEIKVTCVAPLTDICGIPTTLHANVPAMPDGFQFSLEATEPCYYLVTLLEGTGVGPLLYRNGVIQSATLYGDFGLYHYFMEAAEGHHTCFVESLTPGTYTIKHWAFKVEGGEYGVDVSTAEDSIYSVGDKCFVVEKSWTAGDVYLIKPHRVLGIGSATPYLSVVAIIKKSTSEVITACLDSTIFTVPETTDYRIEILDISGIGFYSRDGHLYATVGFSWDCWVSASATISALTGNSPLAMTADNASVKKATLDWSRTAWNLYYDDTETIEIKDEVGLTDYSKTLNACGEDEVYKLAMAVCDTDNRADAITTATITVSPVSVPVGPITFDATFVSFANTNKVHFTLPDDPWDGSLTRFEPGAGSPPWHSYAVDYALFRVAKACEDYRGLDGFQWEIRFYYGSAYQIRYLKSLKSNDAVGVYTLVAWAEDPSLPELPTTITIS